LDRFSLCDKTRDATIVYLRDALINESKQLSDYRLALVDKKTIATQSPE
jgi:hypothetical protein